MQTILSAARYYRRCARECSCTASQRARQALWTCLSVPRAILSWGNLTRCEPCCCACSIMYGILRRCNSVYWTAVVFQDDNNVWRFRLSGTTPRSHSWVCKLASHLAFSACRSVPCQRAMTKGASCVLLKEELLFCVFISFEKKTWSIICCLPLVLRCIHSALVVT